MRAIWLSKFGVPEVLELRELADPVPGPRQALVAVRFASITFVETQARRGVAPFPVQLPRIPGNGVAGEVVAVGAAVDPALVGCRVAGTTGGTGGYAEFALVNEEDLVEIPAGVELDTAAALVADGRTALLLSDMAEVARGEVILVDAAGGGLGSLLVQLGRDRGARVVAAAGSSKKLDIVADLGAEATVNYADPSWTDQVRKAVGEVQVIFDGVGGEVGRDALELLAEGGRMLRYGMASGAETEVPEALVRTRRLSLLSPTRPSAKEARDLVVRALRLAEQGRLKPVIGQRFPLERAAEAHAAIESRVAVGKTLLEVAPSLR